MTSCNLSNSYTVNVVLLVLSVSLYISMVVIIDQLIVIGPPLPPHTHTNTHKLGLSSALGQVIVTFSWTSGPAPPQQVALKHRTIRTPLALFPWQQLTGRAFQEGS